MVAEPVACVEEATAWGLPAIEAWPAIGSTSDRARELARDGAAPGTVVLAREQTAGRGRRGDEWHSAPGTGLWMSMVLPRDATWSGLPLLVGLAAAESVGAMAGVWPRMKWPNDLVLDDRKLGGVLVERGGDWLVAGIGINVSSAPDLPAGGDALAATCLAAEGGHPVEVRTLAGATARAVLDLLAEDRGAVLDRIRALDLLRDRRVWTEQVGSGVARGIEDDGALLVECGGRIVRVNSGRVRLFEAL